MWQLFKQFTQALGGVPNHFDSDIKKMTYIVLNINISSQRYQLCDYITLATVCSIHESCVFILYIRILNTIFAERLSARQLILLRISEIVCHTNYFRDAKQNYVSVTLRNPIISRANAQT